VQWPRPGGEAGGKPFEQRLEALDAFCRCLRHGCAAASRSSVPIRGAAADLVADRENEEPIVSFGVVDTIFFWTFDDGSAITIRVIRT